MKLMSHNFNIKILKNENVKVLKKTNLEYPKMKKNKKIN